MPSYLPARLLDYSGMADIVVKILQGREEVAQAKICSPASAAEAKEGLKDTNAAWVGNLTEPNCATSLIGKRQLTPGGTYVLHLQEKAGEHCKTAPAFVCNRF